MEGGDFNPRHINETKFNDDDDEEEMGRRKGKSKKDSK